MTKVLIAVKGSEEERFFRRVTELAPVDAAEVILLAHVIDAGTRADLELGRDRYLGRRLLGAGRTVDLSRAEEERASAALQFARRALVEAGVPAERLRELVLRGRPNETLRDLAGTEGIDLIVVGGRQEKPGPHSVGKTARFLIDHAPRAAMLVR